MSGETVARAAAAGDPTARRLFERAAWAIGTALGNAANLVNPERFVLGGGVMGAGPAFLEEIRVHLERTCLPEVQVELRLAELGDDAPLWGAFVLAEQALRPVGPG